MLNGMGVGRNDLVAIVLPNGSGRAVAFFTVADVAATIAETRTKGSEPQERAGLLAEGKGLSEEGVERLLAEARMASRRGGTSQ